MYRVPVMPQNLENAVRTQLSMTFDGGRQLTVEQVDEFAPQVVASLRSQDRVTVGNVAGKIMDVVNPKVPSNVTVVGSGMQFLPVFDSSIDVGRDFGRIETSVENVRAAALFAPYANVSLGLPSMAPPATWRETIRAGLLGLDANRIGMRGGIDNVSTWVRPWFSAGTASGTIAGALLSTGTATRLADFAARGSVTQATAISQGTSITNRLMADGQQRYVGSVQQILLNAIAPAQRANIDAAAVRAATGHLAALAVSHGLTGSGPVTEAQVRNVLAPIFGANGPQFDAARVATGIVSVPPVQLPVPWTGAPTTLATAAALRPHYQALGLREGAAMADVNRAFRERHAENHALFTAGTITRAAYESNQAALNVARTTIRDGLTVGVVTAGAPAGMSAPRLEQRLLLPAPGAQVATSAAGRVVEPPASVVSAIRSATLPNVPEVVVREAAAALMAARAARDPANPLGVRDVNAILAGFAGRGLTMRSGVAVVIPEVMSRTTEPRTSPPAPAAPAATMASAVGQTWISSPTARMFIAPLVDAGISEERAVSIGNLLVTNPIAANAQLRAMGVADATRTSLVSSANALLPVMDRLAPHVTDAGSRLELVTRLFTDPVGTSALMRERGVPEGVRSSLVREANALLPVMNELAPRFRDGTVINNIIPQARDLGARLDLVATLYTNPAVADTLMQERGVAEPIRTSLVTQANALLPVMDRLAPQIPDVGERLDVITTLYTRPDVAQTLMQERGVSAPVRTLLVASATAIVPAMQRLAPYVSEVGQQLALATALYSNPVTANALMQARGIPEQVRNPLIQDANRTLPFVQAVRNAITPESRAQIGEPAIVSAALTLAAAQQNKPLRAPEVRQILVDQFRLPIAPNVSVAVPQMAQTGVGERGPPAGPATTSAALVAPPAPPAPVVRGNLAVAQAPIAAPSAAPAERLITSMPSLGPQSNANLGRFTVSNSVPMRDVEVRERSVAIPVLDAGRYTFNGRTYLVDAPVRDVVVTEQRVTVAGRELSPVRTDIILMANRTAQLAGMSVQSSVPVRGLTVGSDSIRMPELPAGRYEIAGRTYVLDAPVRDVTITPREVRAGGQVVPSTSLVAVSAPAAPMAPAAPARTPGPVRELLPNEVPHAEALNRLSNLSPGSRLEIAGTTRRTADGSVQARTMDVARVMTEVTAGRAAILADGVTLRVMPLFSGGQTDAPSAPRAPSAPTVSAPSPTVPSPASVTAAGERAMTFSGGVHTVNNMTFAVPAGSSVTVRPDPTAGLTLATLAQAGVRSVTLGEGRYVFGERMLVVEPRVSVSLQLDPQLGLARAADGGVRLPSGVRELSLRTVDVPWYFEIGGRWFLADPGARLLTDPAVTTHPVIDVKAPLPAGVRELAPAEVPRTVDRVTPASTAEVRAPAAPAVAPAGKVGTVPNLGVAAPTAPAAPTVTAPIAAPIAPVVPIAFRLGESITAAAETKLAFIQAAVQGAGVAATRQPAIVEALNRTDLSLPAVRQALGGANVSARDIQVLTTMLHTRAVAAPLVDAGVPMQQAVALASRWITAPRVETSVIEQDLAASNLGPSVTPAVRDQVVRTAVETTVAMRADAPTVAPIVRAAFGAGAMTSAQADMAVRALVTEMRQSGVVPSVERIQAVVREAVNVTPRAEQATQILSSLLRPDVVRPLVIAGSVSPTGMGPASPNAPVTTVTATTPAAPVAPTAPAVPSVSATTVGAQTPYWQREWWSPGTATGFLRGLLGQYSETQLRQLVAQQNGRLYWHQGWFGMTPGALSPFLSEASRTSIQTMRDQGIQLPRTLSGVLTNDFAHRTGATQMGQWNWFGRSIVLPVAQFLGRGQVISAAQQQAQALALLNVDREQTRRASDMLATLKPGLLETWRTGGILPTYLVQRLEATRVVVAENPGNVGEMHHLVGTRLREPVVVLDAALVRQLSPVQLAFVIGHEIGHLYNQNADATAFLRNDPVYGGHVRERIPDAVGMLAARRVASSAEVTAAIPPMFDILARFPVQRSEFERAVDPHPSPANRTADLARLAELSDRQAMDHIWRMRYENQRGEVDARYLYLDRFTRTDQGIYRAVSEWWGRSWGAPGTFTGSLMQAGRSIYNTTTSWMSRAPATSPSGLATIPTMPLPTSPTALPAFLGNLSSRANPTAAVEAMLAHAMANFTAEQKIVAATQLLGFQTSNPALARAVEDAATRLANDCGSPCAWSPPWERTGGLGGPSTIDLYQAAVDRHVQAMPAAGVEPRQVQVIADRVLNDLNVRAGHLPQHYQPQEHPQIGAQLSAALNAQATATQHQLKAAVLEEVGRRVAALGISEAARQALPQGPRPVGGDGAFAVEDFLARTQTPGQGVYASNAFLDALTKDRAAHAAAARGDLAALQGRVASIRSDVNTPPALRATLSALEEHGRARTTIGQQLQERQAHLTTLQERPEPDRALRREIKDVRREIKDLQRQFADVEAAQARTMAAFLNRATERATLRTSERIGAVDRLINGVLLRLPMQQGRREAIIQWARALPVTQTGRMLRHVDTARSEYVTTLMSHLNDTFRVGEHNPETLHREIMTGLQARLDALRQDTTDLQVQRAAATEAASIAELEQRIAERTEQAGRLTKTLENVRALPGAATQQGRTLVTTDLMRPEYLLWTSAGREAMTNFFQESHRDLQQRAGRSGNVDAIRDRAFALVDLTVSATNGFERLHNEQHIASMFLAGGNNIAELKTGEGKSVVAITAQYLNSFAGEGRAVTVVTTEDFARRDGAEAQRVFDLFGMKVGLVGKEMSEADRQAAYRSNVIYVAGDQLAFDMEHDLLMTRQTPEAASQRYLQTDFRNMRAVVDEIDSVFIDQAKTSFIISQGMGKLMAESQANEVRGLMQLAQGLRVFDRHVERARAGDVTRGEVTPPNTDYVLSRLTHGVERRMSDEALWTKLQEAGLVRMGTPRNAAELNRWAARVDRAVEAASLYRENVDYLVNRQSGEIVLLSRETGKTQDGQRLQQGLHQFLEAKHEFDVNGNRVLSIHEDTRTAARASARDLFSLFGHLSGMTGTASQGRTIPFFRSVYGLNVRLVNPFNLTRRIDYDMQILPDDQYYVTLLQRVASNHQAGAPTLVTALDIPSADLTALSIAAYNAAAMAHAGTGTQASYEQAADAFQQAYAREVQLGNLSGTAVPMMVFLHSVREGRVTAAPIGSVERFDAKAASDYDYQKVIVDQAGRAGQVTIATNMAGRGTDIKLHDEVKGIGLQEVGVGMPDSQRTEWQARGRAGRQGAEGSSSLFVSQSQYLQFLEKAYGYVDASWRLNPPSTRLLRSAQAHVERRTLESIRLQAEREHAAFVAQMAMRELRDQMEAQPLIFDRAPPAAIAKELTILVNQYCPPASSPATWNLTGLTAAFSEKFGINLTNTALPANASRETLYATLSTAVTEHLAQQVRSREIDNAMGDLLQRIDDLRGVRKAAELEKTVASLTADAALRVGRATSQPITQQQLDVFYRQQQDEQAREPKTVAQPQTPAAPAAAARAAGASAPAAPAVTSAAELQAQRAGERVMGREGVVERAVGRVQDAWTATRGAVSTATGRTVTREVLVAVERAAPAAVKTVDLAAAMAATEAGRQAADAALRQARIMAEQGMLDAAAEAYRTALNTIPVENTQAVLEAQHGLADVLLAMGRTSEALPVLEALRMRLHMLDDDDDEELLAQQLVHVYLTEGRLYDAAIATRNLPAEHPMRAWVNETNRALNIAERSPSDTTAAAAAARMAREVLGARNITIALGPERPERLTTAWQSVWQRMGEQGTMNVAKMVGQMVLGRFGIQADDVRNWHLRSATQKTATVASIGLGVALVGVPFLVMVLPAAVGSALAVVIPTAVAGLATTVATTATAVVGTALPAALSGWAGTATMMASSTLVSLVNTNILGPLKTNPLEKLDAQQRILVQAAAREDGSLVEARRAAIAAENTLREFDRRAQPAVRQFEEKQRQVNIELANIDRAIALTNRELQRLEEGPAPVMSAASGPGTLGEAPLIDPKVMRRFELQTQLGQLSLNRTVLQQGWATARGQYARQVTEPRAAFEERQRAAGTALAEAEARFNATQGWAYRYAVDVETARVRIETGVSGLRDQFAFQREVSALASRVSEMAPKFSDLEAKQQALSAAEAQLKQLQEGQARFAARQAELMTRASTDQNARQQLESLRMNAGFLRNALSDAQRAYQAAKAEADAAVRAVTERVAQLGQPEPGTLRETITMAGNAIRSLPQTAWSAWQGMTTTRKVLTVTSLAAAVPAFAFANSLLGSAMSYAVLLPGLIMSIVLHEVAHGRMALQFGDATAQSQGRLTLNPLRHIDPVKSVALPAIMMMVGMPPMAAAKEVPVQMDALTDRQQRWVAAAGPMTNFAIAAGLSLISGAIGLDPSTPVAEGLSQLIQMNIMLGIFNFLPLPPLDGSRILRSAVSRAGQEQIDRLERFGMPLVIVGMITGTLGRIITPAMTLIGDVLSSGLGAVAVLAIAGLVAGRALVGTAPASASAAAARTAAPAPARSSLRDAFSRATSMLWSPRAVAAGMVMLVLTAFPALAHAHKFLMGGKGFAASAERWTITNPSENTLWGIARDVLQAGGTAQPTNTQIANAVREIARANKIADPDRIEFGQEISIPKKLATPEAIETLTGQPATGQADGAGADLADADSPNAGTTADAPADDGSIVDQAIEAGSNLIARLSGHSGSGTSAGVGAGTGGPGLSGGTGGGSGLGAGAGGRVISEPVTATTASTPAPTVAPTNVPVPSPESIAPATDAASAPAADGNVWDLAQQALDWLSTLQLPDMPVNLAGFQSPFSLTGMALAAILVLGYVVWTRRAAPRVIRTELSREQELDSLAVEVTSNLTEEEIRILVEEEEIETPSDRAVAIEARVNALIDEAARERGLELTDDERIDVQDAVIAAATRLTEMEEGPAAEESGAGAADSRATESESRTGLGVSLADLPRIIVSRLSADELRVIAEEEGIEEATERGRLIERRINQLIDEAIAERSGTLSPEEREALYEQVVEFAVTNAIVAVNVEQLFSPAFQDAVVDESQGRLPGYVAVPAVVDAQGRFVMFGNDQHLPEEILRRLSRGELFMVTIHAWASPREEPTDRIAFRLDTVNLESIPASARSMLELTIAAANVRYILETPKREALRAGMRSASDGPTAAGPGMDPAAREAAWFRFKDELVAGVINELNRRVTPANRTGTAEEDRRIVEQLREMIGYETLMLPRVRFLLVDDGRSVLVVIGDDATELPLPDGVTPTDAELRELFNGLEAAVIELIAAFEERLAGAGASGAEADEARYQQWEAFRRTVIMGLMESEVSAGMHVVQPEAPRTQAEVFALIAWLRVWIGHDADGQPTLTRGVRLELQADGRTLTIHLPFERGARTFQAPEGFTITETDLADLLEGFDGMVLQTIESLQQMMSGLPGADAPPAGTPPTPPAPGRAPESAAASSPGDPSVIRAEGKARAIQSLIGTIEDDIRRMHGRGQEALAELQDILRELERIADGRGFQIELDRREPHRIYVQLSLYG
ncbi:MAG: hypothetical protein COV75_06305, partial [Candidatus Omnitrophica bacterium CG11_big_fil_rev_8_21_14_0_20_63_9]